MAVLCWPTLVLLLESIALSSQFLPAIEQTFGPDVSNRKLFLTPAFHFHQFQLNRGQATTRVCSRFAPRLREWPSMRLSTSFSTTSSFRPYQPETRLQRNLFPGVVVEDPAQLNIKVRLILLRSKLVEWYEGPEMALHDIDAISSQFQTFASEQPGWSLIYSNFTNGKGGVSALFKSKLSSDYDVEISLMGLEDYQKMMIMRDASAPNEPYMQLK
jgi:hypothetical protein